MQHILLIMSHFGNKVFNEPVTKNGTSEPCGSTQLVTHAYSPYVRGLVAFPMITGLRRLVSDAFTSSNA